MRRRTPLLASLTAAILCGAAATLAAPAQAAAPVPVTGQATQISPVGAELNGTVDPKGAATTAFFQYGPTNKYGHGTGNQDAGINPGTVPVSAVIAGLQSNKTYHFRIVAENKDGKRFGHDQTFKTLAPTTTPVASPNPVPYGSPFVVTGTIVGTGANGAEVALLSRPFPFTAPFAQLGNSVVADKSGNYLFALTSALSTSQFEVRAKTSPAFTSAVQTLVVTSRISLKTSRKVKRGHSASFSGLVAPGQDGAIVDIQRLQSNGHFKHWTRAFLRHRSDGLSSYSTKKRLFSTTTFRAIVRSNGGNVSPGKSPNVHTIRVTRH